MWEFSSIKYPATNSFLQGENSLKFLVVSVSSSPMKIHESARVSYHYHCKMESQSRRYHRDAHYRDKPVLHEVFLTLEELSRGCTKRMKIAAKVFNDDFRIIRMDEKIITMDVAAGSKDGTKIVVPSAGDVKPGIIPGDVIFVIRERQHPCFTRDDENNLIYKVEISLREALTGCNINIPMLNGEFLTLSTQDVVCHGARKRISGKGMPRGGGNLGDLLVEFAVSFPVELNETQKESINSILPD